MHEENNVTAFQAQLEDIKRQLQKVQAKLSKETAGREEAIVATGMESPFNTQTIDLQIDRKTIEQLKATSSEIDREEPSSSL